MSLSKTLYLLLSTGSTLEDGKIVDWDVNNNKQKNQRCLKHFFNLAISNFRSDFCFVCVDALHPIQQFFSHVGTFSCHLRLNQYHAEYKKCLAEGHNTVLP